MELKVKDDTFYVLEIGDERRIYDTESNAIASLKSLVAEKKDVNPENVNVLEVKIGERWEIKAIPWSKIALELLKGGKQHG
jgi:hypothetical protein